MRLSKGSQNRVLGQSRLQLILIGSPEESTMLDWGYQYSFRIQVAMVLYMSPTVFGSITASKGERLLSYPQGFFFGFVSFGLFTSCPERL